MARKTSLPLREQWHTEQCKHPIYEDDEPHSYLAWHGWAKVKNRTHKQIKCPHCGLFAIWVPREDNG